VKRYRRSPEEFAEEAGPAGRGATPTP
jgi:hypothetical protein